MTSTSSCSNSKFDSLAPLFLRLALGIMIFPHGAQKLLGLFGGYGYSGTMQFFTGNLHIPWVFALCAILIEFFGGIALILGAFTRAAALLVAAELAVGTAMLHLQNGFFMNWSGKQKGEGVEFFILVLGIGIALILSGGGACSVDGMLCGNKPADPPGS